MPLTAVLLAWTMVVVPAQQTSVPPRTNGAADTPKVQLDPNALPVSVEKIQKALEREPLITLREPEFGDSGLPTFRVGVEGQKITIEEILGPDYLSGPVPAGAMTHREFLQMVTPTDVQGYAAFDNKQAVTVALTSLALQWALKTAIQEFREAKDERAKAAAKKEVEEALEALRRARREAGLPDK